jgi:hypothetical protein
MKKFSVLILITAALLFCRGDVFAQEFYLGVKFGLSSQVPEFEGEEVEYNVDTRTLYGFRLGLSAGRVAL